MFKLRLREVASSDMSSSVSPSEWRRTTDFNAPWDWLERPKFDFVPLDEDSASFFRSCGDCRITDLLSECSYTYLSSSTFASAPLTALAAPVAMTAWSAKSQKAEFSAKMDTLSPGEIFRRWERDFEREVTLEATSENVQSTDVAGPQWCES